MNIERLLFCLVGFSFFFILGVKLLISIKKDGDKAWKDLRKKGV